MMEVDIFDNGDSGEIYIDPTKDYTRLSGGLGASCYLSLFGGNIEDSGDPGDSSMEYWGNKLESSDSLKYRSRFQYAITSLPITSKNIQRVADAARADLQWMTDTGFAASVAVSVSLVGRSQLRIIIDIESPVFGTERLEYYANWRQDANY